MPLDQRVFFKFDLNSLVTFMVVYQTGGVTRAALALDVTQPAVSNTLGRLRTHFRDPLFIPQGRKVRPTEVARDLAQALEPAMETIQSIIAARHKPEKAKGLESGESIRGKTPAS